MCDFGEHIDTHFPKKNIKTQKKFLRVCDFGEHIDTDLGKKLWQSIFFLKTFAIKMFATYLRARTRSILRRHWNDRRGTRMEEVIEIGKKPAEDAEMVDIGDVDVAFFGGQPTEYGKLYPTCTETKNDTTSNRYDKNNIQLPDPPGLTSNGTSRQRFLAAQRKAKKQN